MAHSGGVRTHEARPDCLTVTDMSPSLRLIQNVRFSKETWTVFAHRCLNTMAPNSIPSPVLQIRQFDEDGPTHLEVLGICIGGLCVLLLMVFVCWKTVERVRARRYWQATSPTVRFEATGASPSQPNFPFNDKQPQPTTHSREPSVDATAAMATPSPVYDALKAGRPPSYRTSVMMLREATARETAAETSSADRP